MARNTENEPVVSVVIPAYNAEEHLAATISSVLPQTYQNFEVIVVDDGSTDGTADVVEGFGSEVRYVYKENAGSASARNRGIEEARGRYIAFLDADDRWKPEKLERQMARFEREANLMWCYTDSLLVDAHSREVLFRKSQVRDRPEGHVFEELLPGNFVAPSTVVIRAEVFDEVGVFDESALHRISEDWDLWLRIAERYPIGFVSEPLVITWHHARRKTETMDLEQALASRGTIIQRALNRNPDVPPETVARAWANLYVSIGRKWLNREERKKARQHFYEALSFYPKEKQAWIFFIASYIPRPILRLMGGLRQQVRTWARSNPG